MGTRQIEGTSWTLSNGTLIIISTAAMLDYNDGRHAPWYKYRDLITTVAITNGVTRIGDYAFGDCISLTSITIPNSVRCIGTYAFEDCLSLRNVVVLRTSPPSIDSNTFYNVLLSSATLTVPKGSKAAYQRAEGWNEFGTIVDHSKNEEKQSDNEAIMDTKRCPYCGEEILAVAKKCKHCGEWLEQIPQKTKMATEDHFRNFYEEKQFSPVPGSGCTWTEEHSRNEEIQFFPVPGNGFTWPEDHCKNGFYEEKESDNEVTMETKNGQTNIINPSNGAGTAGFVCALIALLSCWIPVLGWILWLFGLFFSFVGVFNYSPKGFAVTGVIISLIDFILLLTVGIDVWDDVWDAWF